MSNLDLDALERLLATEAADPFAIIEHVPALIAMARRTEEAEREAEREAKNEREAALHAEHERDEARRELVSRADEFRAPLDPAHVAVLQNWLESMRAGFRQFATVPTVIRERIAALEAVLGEGATYTTPEQVGPHPFAGDGHDCARCGEGSQHYLHTDRGEA